MSNAIRDHYTLLIDKTKGSDWYVMINDGLYQGLIYRYIKFQISKEENKDGTRHFRFEREIIRVPPHLEGVLLPDSEESEVNNLMANVLLDILENYFEQEELVLEEEQPEPDDQ